MNPSFAETRLWLFATVMSLAGCAPSFELFGAFFPAWMLCATIGIIAGLSARAVFVATRLTDVLPYQLVVCTAIGAIFAISVSLLVFER